jgi:WD40 repeat protein
VDFKGVLRQWAMGTDQPVRTLKLQTPPPAVLGWNNDLVDISPDCHWAVVRGRDVTGSIWKNIGGKEVEISAHADLSPYFLIWDLWTGQLKTKLRCSHWEFGRAAFTPDGDWLASGGEREEFQVPTGHDKLPDGRSRGVVQVWDWRTGRSIWRWRLRSQVLALSWARNGVLAVAGADELIIHQPGKEVTSVPLVGEISIWRPGQRQCLMRKTLRFHAEEVAITPDAR